MTQLYYYYIEVFGSNFDAEGFCKDVNLVGAEIYRREKSRPCSPIRAIVKGNVNSWQTPKHYYNLDETEEINPFLNYLYEEKAVVSFVNGLQYINKILPPYRTDTTETWLHLIYLATEEEKPAGVFFGKELIEALCKLGASITTEVVFSSSLEQLG